MSRLISNIGVLAAYLIVFTVAYMPVVKTHFFVVDDYNLALPNSTHEQLYYEVFVRSISSGRALAGYFEYKVFDYVHSLQPAGLDSTVRFVGIIGLVLLAYVIYCSFKANRVKAKYAFLAGILICTLPAFQVYVSWLIINSLPYATACAAIAGLLVYKAVFSEVKRSSLNKAVMICTAVLSLVASLHFYQPAAMFYWSLCIIPLVLLKDENFTDKWRAPFITYFLIGFVSMAIHFINVKLVNSVMGFSSFGGRGGFIPFNLGAIKGKIYWLFKSSHSPILNSLNLWNISPSTLLGGIVLTTIVAGLLLSMRKAILKAVQERKFDLLWNHSQRILFIIIVLPLNLAPVLVVKESWATYRTIAALEVSICILLILSLLIFEEYFKSNTMPFKNLREKVVSLVLILFAVFIVYDAHGNVKKYFVELHSLELQYVKNAIQEFGIPEVSKTSKIYFKGPEHPYQMNGRFRFEFGYASTNETGGYGTYGFGEYVIPLALYDLGIKNKVEIIQVPVSTTSPEDRDVLIIDFTKLKFFLDENLSKKSNNIKELL